MDLPGLYILLPNNENSAIRGREMTHMQKPTLDAETAKAANAFLAIVSARYPVNGAILFGSRARGGFHRNSDADIAVVLRGRAVDFLATKLDLADIAYDILLETGIRIQPFPIWEVEWLHPETYSNPRLLHNIDREGIRL
jgi:predicted nucleotidyltransferase